MQEQNSKKSLAEMLDDLDDDLSTIIGWAKFELGANFSKENARMYAVMKIAEQIRQKPEYVGEIK
jgi:hypothetical protein